MCSGNCNISLNTLNKEMRGRISNAPKISRSDFAEGDIYAKSLFAYYLNPNGFLDALRVNGIEVDSSSIYDEILGLSELSKSGQDIKGFLTDEIGNPIYFDYSKIVGSIPISKKQLVKNPIIFI
jgi:hypothetical protein